MIQGFGGSAQVETTQKIQLGNYEGIKVSGLTTSPSSSTRWIAVFAKSSQGVVGVSAGCNPIAFSSQKAVLEKVLASVRIQ
jgi:hypothetical protein